MEKSSLRLCVCEGLTNVTDMSLGKMVRETASEQEKDVERRRKRIEERKEDRKKDR